MEDAVIVSTQEENQLYRYRAHGNDAGVVLEKVKGHFLSVLATQQIYSKDCIYEDIDW